MTHNLIINHRDIKCDAQGRISLGDLHISAGGDKKYQPSNYLRNERTQKLIKTLAAECDGARSSDLRNAPIHTVQGGNAKEQGTYVVKELVYDYAMWISPAFALRVIRAFDLHYGPGAARQPDVQALQAENLELKRRLFEAKPRWVALADMRAAGRSNRMIARGLGVGLRIVERDITAIKREGFGAFLPEAAHAGPPLQLRFRAVAQPVAITSQAA